MSSNRKFALISIFIGLAILLVAAIGVNPASGEPMDSTSPSKALAPQVDFSLSLDDGTAEDAIGWSEGWELIFWNRFTPLESQFPFNLTEIQVYFRASTVTAGDKITLVVYEDKDSVPANGATLLYSSTTTVQAAGTWNTYPIPTDVPVTLNGPGDVLVGVIALEKPAADYFPAAIDETTSQHRSWIGWWLNSPPNPSNFPPDDAFVEVNSTNFEFDGNWMVRTVGTTTAGPGNSYVYLPTIFKEYPPIPAIPVLSPINNSNGGNDFTVSWNDVARAESYLLEEDDNQDFSSPSIVYNGVSISWNAWDKPVGTYYYRVKAHNSWGDSNWSNIVNTTVVPPYPGIPALSLINNPNNDSDYVISWNSVINAETYILEEDDNQTFSSPATVYNGSSTFWNAWDKPGGTFYYRVKAHNTWGDSNWSNIVSTTVVPPPPPQSTVYVVNNTGCTLWYEIKGTGIGQKTYSSGRNLYGTFPVGTYTFTASACCGSTTQSKTFSAGEYDHTFSCVGQPAGENVLEHKCELK